MATTEKLKTSSQTSYPLNPRQSLPLGDQSWLWWLTDAAHEPPAGGSRAETATHFLNLLLSKWSVSQTATQQSPIVDEPTAYSAIVVRGKKELKRSKRASAAPVWHHFDHTLDVSED